jgi:hypothetical protein
MAARPHVNISSVPKFVTLKWNDVIFMNSVVEVFFEKAVVGWKEPEPIS